MPNTFETTNLFFEISERNLKILNEVSNFRTNLEYPESLLNFHRNFEFSNSLKKLNLKEKTEKEKRKKEERKKEWKKIEKITKWNIIELRCPRRMCYTALFDAQCIK